MLRNWCIAAVGLWAVTTWLALGCWLHHDAHWAETRASEKYYNRILQLEQQVQQEETRRKLAENRLEQAVAEAKDACRQKAEQEAKLQTELLQQKERWLRFRERYLKWYADWRAGRVQPLSPQEWGLVP
jgi:hypothetical protein